MRTLLLAAGAAALALSAGSTLAATKHQATATAASPKQPIPYAQLDAYLKASPAQRAKKDWSGQAVASTGASANTSTTTAASPDTSATAPSPEAPPTPAPPAAAAPSTEVNPPTAPPITPPK